MSKRATLAQVAAFAGVSIATASRCFSNPELLKPETVTLVRQAASALHYKAPRILERDLSMARIAVLTQLFNHQGGTERLRGISNALRAWPHELIVHDVTVSKSSVVYVKKLLATKRIEGLIFSGLPILDEVAINIQRFELPTVLIDIDDSRFSRVLTSEKKGCELAADYFNNSDATNVLFFGARPSEIDINPGIRLKSFRERLNPQKRSAGIELLVDPFSHEAGVEIRKLLKSKGKVDAIFADSDLLALSVCLAARELGISIPKDLLLIGYGDCDSASQLGISTVRTHLDASGRRAVEILRGHDHSGEPARVELKPELILRSTT
jgi:LacI family transcriptional regulator